MCWWLVPNAAFAQRYIPDCAGSPLIPKARVMRVAPNGDLILRDGRIVALEGIRLPDTPYRIGALSSLRALVQKGPVTFAVTPPGQDRYGRIRAQGFAEVWLQTTLLERGLAQVQISPDRSECFPEFYEAEVLARSRRLGLWRDGAQPRGPQTVKADGRFQLVEGRVADVGQRDGRTMLRFEGRQGLSAVIPAEDRRAFRDFDLEGLEARRIRIRGIVQGSRGGPEMALSNPAQIEMLD